MGGGKSLIPTLSISAECNGGGMNIDQSKRKGTFFLVSAILLSALAVTSILGIATFGWFKTPEVIEAKGIYVNYAGVNYPRYLIIGLLTFSAIASWVRTTIWRNLTFISLALILVGYVLWAIATLQLRFFSEYNGSQDTFFLRHATLWDIAVLVTVLIIFAGLTIIKVTKIT
jgi:hypothetical protein